MPIYEYACKHCEHTLTALQKMNDEPLVDCPECGKAQLRRLISAPRFRLKGAGWYETDFKKDNQRNIAKGDSDTDKGGSKADTTGKTESSGKTAEPAGKTSDTASKSSDSGAAKSSDAKSSASNSKEAS